ncbi:thiamine phosphate synthase [uncultured Martelella sp.]|uniref:thiamine phosphate synthase n=1 Tax=uncultured Martelella sp. TaxID=392331 RepID=UPI0029C8B21E|nr:thiamine phosphate synthase [uncultured Martelella sp.]
MRPVFDLSLYLVLDPVLCSTLGMTETTRQAVRGGATMVQLRMKDATTSERIAAGRKLQQVLAGTDARLIVNDDVEAAIALGADGVHVGQSDDDPVAVRAKIGPDMLLGLSIDSLEAARCFNPAPLDYIGAGPVFATGTKPGHAAPLGFDGLAEVAGRSGLPVVAIGGLKAEHIPATFQAGADGIAVVSAICGQPDPHHAAVALSAAIGKAKT